MLKPTISMIAATSKNTRAIGKNNKLLWKLPGDMARFKQITSGHPVIMGKKTFESMGSRALPNRLNIVLTRDDEQFPGAVAAMSPEEAIKKASASDTTGADEIFIIGGGEIYKLYLPIVDKLYLTIVDDYSEGDTFFPDWSEFKNVIFEERHDGNNPPFSFVELTR